LPDLARLTRPISPPATGVTSAEVVGGLKRTVSVAWECLLPAAAPRSRPALSLELASRRSGCGIARSPPTCLRSRASFARHLGEPLWMPHPSKAGSGMALTWLRGTDDHPCAESTTTSRVGNLNWCQNAPVRS
jgi:hypothetical protein